MNYLQSRIVPIALLATLAATAACSRDPEERKRAYLESAKRYVSQEKYGEASVEFRNAIQIDPGFGEAHEGLADALAGTGDAAGAVRELVRAADLMPTRHDLQIKVGALLLMAGRYDDARVRAGKVIAADPKNVSAQILNANALAGLKDFEKALSEIQQAIALDPTRSTSFSALGALQLARGQAVEAENAFQRAVELDGNAASPQLALANFYWMSGREREAEAAFARALALEPRNLLANRAMATFYMASRRAPEAEPYFRVLAEDARDSRARLDLADYYATLQRYDEALTTLEPLTGDRVSGIEARLRVAVVKHLQRQTAEAHRLVDEVLSENPKHVGAVLTRARLLVHEGKLDEALAPASEAVQIEPTSLQAHYLLGTIHARQRRGPEARRQFARVLELNPRAVAAQVELAHLELMAGEVAASRGHAQSAVSAQPDNATARLLLAKTYIAENKLDVAERELKALAQGYPTWATVQTSLGMLHLRRQNERAARAAFEAAVKLAPNTIEPFAALVAMDVRKGDLPAARVRVEARLAASPNDTAALLLAARAYSVMKESARSEQILKSLIEREPGNLQAYGDLAQLYVREGRLDEARAAFEQVATKDPKSVAAQTMIGMILQIQNRPAEAAKRYEQALAASGNSPVAANNLAWIYAEEGRNLERAVELAKSAKQASPDRAEISDTLGFVYLKKGVPDLAVTALRDAVKQDPENPRYRLRLGVALARSGSADEARRQLNPVLRSNPELPEAAEARAALAELR